MPTQIDQLELQVDPAPAAAAGGGGEAPLSQLPSPQQALRAAWLAARQAELQARWAAFDRDDER